MADTLKHVNQIGGGSPGADEHFKNAVSRGGYEEQQVRQKALAKAGSPVSNAYSGDLRSVREGWGASADPSKNVRLSSAVSLREM